MNDEMGFKHLMKNKKILHIIAHVAGWFGYFFIPSFIESLQGDPDAFHFPNLLILIQILMVVYFYVNYLVLIPGLVFKKKYLLYALATIAIIFGFSFTIEFVVQTILPPFREIGQPVDFGPDKPVRDMFGPLKGISVFLVVFVISTALKMSVEWFRNEKKRKELENDKLKAELQALRAQIDPHFFFNVLNNICSLARKKSDDTEAFIIRLSELIRYSLYENKGEKFFLEKEINFLKNYIEIQQMRLDKNAEIAFDYSNTNVNLMIEPMLLFPFVENAFKHGVSYRGDVKIEIIIKTDGSVLYFEVTNPLIQETSSDKAGGIGIMNVEKRLNLLYPNRHKLEIDNNNGLFSVKLKIDL